MSFCSGNAFAGDNYVYARHGKAAVFGEAISCEEASDELAAKIKECDAVVVGAGAGLSSAAGFTYSGERFKQNFADFQQRFGISDMYSGGFYPFPDMETYWAWWSRQIKVNRYGAEATALYSKLLDLLSGKEYFVITTNVDHQFQLAGFDKQRLFYTQGDYGLFQCSRNCSGKVVDNEQLVSEMVARQRNMRIPSELIPYCPYCGAPMVPNLRVDGLFCEPRGWHEAASRYQDFCAKHARSKVLYLELGVGNNTPVIIKYPFWNAVAAADSAIYACLNGGEACAPASISSKSILIDEDMSITINRLARVSLS